MSAPARAPFPVPNRELEFAWNRPLVCDENSDVFIYANFRSKICWARVFQRMVDENGREEILLVDEIDGRCITREKIRL